MVENITDRLRKSIDEIPSGPIAADRRMLRSVLVTEIIKQRNFVEGVEFAMEPRTNEEFRGWFHEIATNSWELRESALDGIRATIGLGLSHISEEDVSETERHYRGYYTGVAL